MLVDAFIWLWVTVMFPSPIGRCDPAPDDKLNWTRAERQEAREMANDSVRARGARPIFVAYLDSVAIRESSAFASRWHDDGTGLGMHGLNVKYFGEGRNLCDPRESAEVVQGIARRAITKHGAENAFDIQAVFAGRMECSGRVTEKTCTGEMQDRTHRAICGRMEARGFSCFDRIRLEDIGE